MDKRVYLKVKIKSLAEEARIIRKEENKRGPLWWGLRLHRTGIVKSEARAALLAYGFLRGLTYRQIEANTKFAPDWARVKKLVDRYGVYLTDEQSMEDYVQSKKEQAECFEQWYGKARTGEDG